MIIMSRNSLKSNNFDTKPFYRILFYLKFKPLHRIIHKKFFGYSQNSDNMFCFHKWCELDVNPFLHLGHIFFSKILAILHNTANILSFDLIEALNKTHSHHAQ